MTSSSDDLFDSVAGSADSDDDAGGGGASSGGGDDFVTITFDPPFKPGPKAQLKFDGMSGVEELGRPFTYYLQMTSGALKVDVSSLLGASAVVKLTTSKTDADPTYINAVVGRVVSRGLSGGSYRYDVELRPWIWLLSHITDSRIFQEKTAFEIVTSIFRDAGFSDFEDKRNASSGDLKLIYCVQYRETSLDFVTRLMEEFGFYYYFTHSSSSHTLVFADDPNSHTELSQSIPFMFDQTEYRTFDDHIWEWAGDANLTAGKVTLKDYNFGTPSMDLTKKLASKAATKHGDFEIYEYPGRYFTAGDGDTVVGVRIEEVKAERLLFHGASNSRKLHAGVKFDLSGCPDDNADGSYLLVRSEMTTSLAEGLGARDDEDGGESIDTYRVLLHSITGTTKFRLQRKTARPMIRGPQTAKVVGASGEEITTDKYGRIRIKFHWDRSEPEDETCTCWVRVAQGWAGASWGSMFIPRIGMEVIVEFLEGNPDRPIVTGCVYNGRNGVPYTLPDEKTKSTVKTNTSLDGGGYNEFRFEDKKDSEEIYFQAQKDYNKLVKNDETANIKHDRTHTVTNNDTLTVSEGNRSVTVSKGNDTHLVSEGNRSVTVTKGDDTHEVSAGKLSVTVMKDHTTTVNSGNFSLTVTAGSHTISVPANSSSLTASTGITLTCGASSISMTPSSISITSGSISITGTEAISQTAPSISLTGAEAISITTPSLAIA